MRYLSTRGTAAPLEFEDVLLEGLARDGGLYVPEEWPQLTLDQIAAFKGQPYVQVAESVIAPFAQGIDPAALRKIIVDAYASFRAPDVTPLIDLRAIAPNLHLLELFHGPTLAFKDVAMQVLGGLFDHVLAKRNERVTIIGATSGDTGSAAIEAVAGREHASIFIMHPHGRTSEVQRRQMTTVTADNVYNVAVEGTFDDCQNLLKAMFNDQTFRDEVSMSGVNSINWARLMPQVVYYMIAAVHLGGPQKKVAFSVPTGNFGDIFAGYAASKMGLPIERLIIASNQNDILTRVMRTGEHALGPVAQTMSPSMDIQISSNFERLLFDMLGRDGAAVTKLMEQLQQDQKFVVPAAAIDTVRDLFGAERVDEELTLATMKLAHDKTGEFLDPHTAIGVAAAIADRKQNPSDTPLVVLGTAHPAKFPDAVEKATGVRPPLPEHLADLYERKEHFDVLPNDLAAVQSYVRSRAAS